jgi:hypothetical protein
MRAREKQNCGDAAVSEAGRVSQAKIQNTLFRTLAQYSYTACSVDHVGHRREQYRLTMVPRGPEACSAELIGRQKWRRRANESDRYHGFS